MYKINYKYYSNLNRRFILYIISFFTIVSFLSIALPMLAQDEASDEGSVAGAMTDVMELPDESDYDLDDEMPDTDITTKIYRSADLSTESLNKSESELDPAVDADVIDKDELIRNSKSMIYVFGKDKQTSGKLLNKPSNPFLPWILLFVILTIIFVVLMVAKKTKI